MGESLPGAKLWEGKSSSPPIRPSVLQRASVLEKALFLEGAYSLRAYFECDFSTVNGECLCL